jgi:plasmid replication initiation protein
MNKLEKLHKANTGKALPDRSVSMSNALSRGAQGLNLSQKRVIALAMASTDSIASKMLIEGQVSGWKVRLTAADYAATFEVDSDTAYNQLKDSSRSLLKCLWRTVEPTKKGEVITEGPWAILAQYRKGEGCVDLTFSPHVAPHLLALRKHFTTYQLKQAAALRSIYAWRLFECLKSWESTGVWSPTIEEFQKAMNAPPSARENFKELRRAILEPAIKELREKDNLLIECEQKTRGRKVVGLVLRFTPDPQGSLPL